MALATLSVDLVAKMANFEKDLGKAARAAESNAAKMNAAFSGIKAGLAGLAAGVGVGGLVSLAKATIDSLDALNDLSDATGASIENISALEDVAARTGTKFETVQTALVKFNAALNSAKKDSPQAAAIEAIGLSVEKLKARDPAEALRQTAVALAQFADDGNKARLTQELFGKSLKEVAPLLKDLAESGALVATVTTAQAKEAEKFNQQLSVLQKNIQDASRDMAGPMVTAINALIVKFKEGREAGAGFFDIIGNALRDDIRRLNGEAPNTGGATGSWGPDAGGGRGSVNPANVRPSLPSSLDKDTGGKTGATKDLYAEAKRYLETLEREIEKSQELNRVQQLGIDINKGRYGPMTVDLQNLLVTRAIEIDVIRAESQAEKELTEILKQKRQASIEAGDAVAEANKEYQNLLARLLSATPTANFDAQQRDLQILKSELESGRIDPNLYAEAVSARLGLVGEEASNKFADELHNDVKGALSSAFRDTEDPVAAFGDALGNVVYTRITSALAESLTTQLVGGPNGGGLLSSALSFLSFDGGGYTGAGARYGGMDGKGGFMAMLHPQESVVDHTKGQRSGGQQIINNNYFTVGDVASISMVKQAVSNSQRQIVAAFARSQNYGGAVA